MTDEIDIRGVCPSVGSKTSPEWGEERDEYICPACEFGLGETAREARSTARKHLNKDQT